MEGKNVYSTSAAEAEVFNEHFQIAFARFFQGSRMIWNLCKYEPFKQENQACEPFERFYILKKENISIIMKVMASS
jgi:hypothetical protein